MKKSDNARQHVIPYAVCIKVTSVTQSAVVAAAAVGFCFISFITAYKFVHSRLLEIKQDVVVDKPWFKFAICLRPFYTPSMLTLFYELHKSHLDDKSFHAYLKELHHKAPESAVWDTSMWLDPQLQPKDYETYFKHIHPWDKLPVSQLWDFQYKSTQKVFKRFKVNKYVMTTLRDNLLLTDKNRGDNSYTVLRNETSVPIDAKREDFVLFGDYSLSPLYVTCLNITVNESMSKRQMEITVDFNKDRLESNKSGHGHHSFSTASLFEFADVYVYGANEDFSEVPIIQNIAKYSIQKYTLERLLVKGSSYEKKSVHHSQCYRKSDYSQTNCRHWCILRELFSVINCTLPWMKHALEKPWIDKKFKALKVCDNGKAFLQTLRAQKRLFYQYAGDYPKETRICITETCPVNCQQFKVELLSLGSKSIGNKYGISLTVSPTIRVVKDEREYTIIEVVCDLSATISFLSGLSAIGIIDWFGAMAMWVVGRLKSYRPGKSGDQPETDPEAEAGAESESGAEAGAAGAEAEKQEEAEAGAESGAEAEAVDSLSPVPRPTAVAV